ncbi:3-deoxy-7-phosphoheptulonate synthase AroG [uncultured Parasutterella sp.]|uniref:3-deoxy-7-phosphoheptulonate synthase AroG n=1 Tax=uncultured Parasutterella sp. TaxID=1263098 RepID=UPI0025B5348B|nr:3-deoxy-7-phosphoheptulonate synthase AroG [uncultured Parasutterella sp.]
MMAFNTDDVRIKEIRELTPPSYLIREFPCGQLASTTVHLARTAGHEIIHGLDDRLLVIVGPCSIHDPKAAVEYAEKLVDLRRQFADDLEIIMRVYFEKPRTTIGWKGLINDPDLDCSYHINHGLRVARELLLDINELGVPAGTEYLDMITPQYIADLISWGAIGARTTESQVHRELASGLSCPVGFKNGTDGNVKIAIDAINAASHEHVFLSVTKGGHSAIVVTGGNEDCHVILRGGKTTNYDEKCVSECCEKLQAAGLRPSVMIDASHSNSHKKHKEQLTVVQDICRQISSGSYHIMGVMLESNLVEGNQPLVKGKEQELVYGQSITDACLGWDDTVKAVESLAHAVKDRRDRNR